MGFKQTAFARASQMMALVSVAMLLPAMQQQAALARIGPYESRGKGGKQPGRHVGTKAHARVARKARNVRRHRAACRG